MKRALVIFTITVLFLVACGCSAPSPASPHAEASAMAEKIHAGQGDYDRLVLADPDNATAWLIRGMYYNDAFGQYGEALRCYNRSLELDPASGPAWYAKGVALRNMQRFNESGTCFEQAGKYGFFEKP